MIKVLIVEDSITSRELLHFILDSDPDIKVVGTASNGQEACDFVRSFKPDVITMDINMPLMDGFEATRRIMATVPVAIIIISAHLNTKDVSSSFKAIDAGAVAILDKPVALNHPDFDKSTKVIIQKVKTMSEVKLVRRWYKSSRISAFQKDKEVKKHISPASTATKIIAIGGSTGAPAVLKTILSRLPSNFPVPLVLVQHITPGFVDGMINWLNQETNITISIPVNGEKLLPGHAYIAPDALQMGVNRQESSIVLKNDPLEHRIRPSVSYMFRSVASQYGPNVIGVLLTGMGADGSLELKSLKDNGAITIAQNKESSIVFGMPGEAVALGGATHILNPEEIASILIKLVGNGEE
ncbi:MAG: chemotaxis-specific protein-glutamate methyltransferase CheB [Spirochaetaceae bacterium]